MFQVWRIPTLAFLVLASVAGSIHAQGIAITGVGPVNRSMGGAGTAAPLDAIGALHWNPASISALPCSEVSFGVEMLLADVDLTTSTGLNAGSTSGEPGVAPIPAIGWVHHLEGTPLTVGLGIYGIGGFRNNFPFDPTNPLIAALNQPIFADAEILQMTPTVSWALTDRLSIGVSPTVTAAKVQFMPLGPSVITPAPTLGTGTRVHWGGGVQVGVYYLPTEDWHFGLSIKSPQWFEDFRFFTPTGVVKFDIDYPMIVSAGIAYSGFEDWIFAADFRYWDYDNTAGFSEFGWSNVFAAAFGAQYRVNDCWHVRFGYNFNRNPINPSDLAANAITPLIQEHNFAGGFSYRFARNVDINLSYIYLLNNAETGPLPLLGPAGTITNEIEAHSLGLGVTVRY